jgi:hypothetical protein
MLKQADRKPEDGPISVTREGEKIRVVVETGEVSQSILMSEYNAARVFGALSVTLEVPLSKAVAKAIKL